MEQVLDLLRVEYAEEYARQVQRSLTTLNSWVVPVTSKKAKVMSVVMSAVPMFST